MDDGHYLHIDRGKAAFDRLDGEVIIVDVVSGLYFNLQGTAVAIWEAIECGTTLAGLHRRMAERFEGDAETIAAAVDGMVATLSAEGLLVARPEPPSIVAPAPAAAAREAFIAPVVERYTDVQDLLTLDPIHDVSDFGWPHPKDGAATPE
ncbi:MAG: PqqD family protein, partial [Alphaproteobacteria bacterium]